MPPFPSATSTWHDNSYPALSPTRSELSAKGKNVIITGGGTGIGAETARYFAEAGASKIAILGRRPQPLQDTKASITAEFPKVEVIALPTDIGNKHQVDAAFSKFGGAGKIHVLISNAAVVGPMESVEDAEPEALLAAVHQNLMGSLLVAQAFLRHAAKDAVVIDINSAAAHLNVTPAMVSYNISKLAVFRMWNSLGFAKPNLSIFHIQPGVIDTDMNKQAGGVAAIGFEDHVSLPASFNVWLASPEARFLRGKFLYANWDVDELKARAGEIEGSRQLNIDLVGWPFGDAQWKPTWDN